MALQRGPKMLAPARHSHSISAYKMCQLVFALTYFILGALVVLSYYAGRGSAVPLFDELSGAPKNAAAREILRRGDIDARKWDSVGSPWAEEKNQSTLDDIAEVQIAEGLWKFVLVVVSSAQGEHRQVVRSYAGYRYHAQMAERLAELEVRPRGLSSRVLGGGRIERTVATKVIHVYGYSKTYGRCAKCNQKVAEVSQRLYPLYTVTWSNDGY